MRHLILSSAALMVVMAIASEAVKANPQVAANRETAMTTMQQTTPFNLVDLAYRGYFADQGINSYTQFVSAIRSNRVTAESLVETAISVGKLSPDTRQDSGYINAVKLQLNSLERDS